MPESPSVISPFIRGPASYRARAEKLRAMAGDMAACEWADILLRLADSYEDSARSTELESCSL
ncbi:MAG TPA: hypothetical protein VLC74_13095 [Rhizomicrobium sp.]|nr:hypothetical protein [Rhizomicrobium sp.]